MKKGANFREQQPISFAKTLNSFSADLDNFITKWSKRENIPLGYFEPWSNKIFDMVRNNLKTLGDCDNSNNNKIILKDPTIIDSLHSLHERFVIVPIDKASNNFALICKHYYIKRMNKELGITNSEILGNDIYSPCNDDPNSIISRQIKDLKDLHIQVRKDQHKLPLLYFNSKQHKNPYKERFIAGASKCTTKTLSVEVSLALKLLKSHFKNYCNKIFKRTGINCFWSIENSNEFLQKLKKVDKASSIHTFDFSTLYTNLPLKKLEISLQQFIMKMFNNSDHKFINVNSSKKNAFWSNTKYLGHKIYNCNDLIDAVKYILDNTYVTYGPLLFKQITGIPMGGNCSQDMADIHLIWREYTYMIRLMKTNFDLAKKLSNNSRYIDDIATLNIDNFGKLALEIYDRELLLEPSQTNGLEDNFLDINIRIINNTFIT